MFSCEFYKICKNIFSYRTGENIVSYLIYICLASHTTLPRRSMTRSEINLGKRLVSLNNPNKYELTFNLQGDFFPSGKLMDCISEGSEMSFIYTAQQMKFSIKDFSSKCDRHIYWRNR